MPDQDKPLVAVKGENGSLGFYEVQAILPVAHEGVLRQYAFLVATFETTKGKPAMVLRYEAHDPEGSLDGQLTSLESEGEVAAVMEALSDHLEAVEEDRRARRDAGMRFLYGGTQVWAHRGMGGCFVVEGPDGREEVAFEDFVRDAEPLDAASAIFLREHAE
jgi:hypothetical protein